MLVKNTVALVTGANRGIGLALVKALLMSGANKVYAGARDLKTLEPVRALDPTRVIPLHIDVTDGADVSTLPHKAPDTTLLINNAGVLAAGGILEVPLKAIERDFNTNFFGTLNMARAFVPVIEGNRGGAVVNILTLVALASFPGFAAYNASKAAAWSMTQSLRAGVAGKRIAVHGVYPGAVDTDMLAGVEVPKTSAADVAAAIIAGIESDQEDIFPDPMSKQMYAAWRQDHKAVERQFASM